MDEFWQLNFKYRFIAFWLRSVTPVVQLVPASARPDQQGGGAFLLGQHDAERPDRHPPGSVWSGSDASFRVGLAIRY